MLFPGIFTWLSSSLLQKSLFKKLWGRGDGSADKVLGVQARGYEFGTQHPLKAEFWGSCLQKQEDAWELADKPV